MKKSILVFSLIFASLALYAKPKTDSAEAQMAAAMGKFFSPNSNTNSALSQKSNVKYQGSGFVSNKGRLTAEGNKKGAQPTKAQTPSAK
jgi:hypothetical protein